MGTSNWHHIPFVAEAMLSIAPASVLDVGVGFGRWGFLAREFCDAWPGRIHPDQWRTRVEGIEAFPRNVAGYHRAFYGMIHEGDAAQILPLLPGTYDLIIFGDVLEHFERATGERLLDLAVNMAAYVIVNVPLGPEHPQGEAYGNPYERHLSIWETPDFDRRALVRRALFRDYIQRPFGSFVLSRSDPKRLRNGAFTDPSLVVPTERKIAVADELGGRTLLKLVLKKALRRLGMME